MNVLIFGATGMVGQGVLRECLLASDVERVTVIGRTATGIQHAKLRDLVVPDLMDYRNVETELRGFDACFFCLGVSSAGMDEAASVAADAGIGRSQFHVGPRDPRHPLVDMKLGQERQRVVECLEQVLVVFDHPAAHVDAKPLLVDVELVAVEHVSQRQVALSDQSCQEHRTLEAE